MHPQIEAASTHIISFDKLFGVPPSRVFSAFVNSSLLKTWFHPLEGKEIFIEEWDARLGGRYIVTFPKEPSRILTGIFEDFEQDSLLSFTWGWDDEHRWGENRVTITFADDNGTTQLKLVQGIFPNKQIQDELKKTWSRLLEQLEKAL